jgi:hypothetical protein
MDVEPVPHGLHSLSRNMVRPADFFLQLSAHPRAVFSRPVHRRGPSAAGAISFSGRSEPYPLLITPESHTRDCHGRVNRPPAAG